MKKQFLLLLALFSAVVANAQSRGIKIAYIDMEYILEKSPDYAEAKNQLEMKAQKWKQEIEAKKNDITKLKESLKTEKVLLTKELIVEREEEIASQEKELMDYQEKRFGPKGDLISQKSVLVKPIQDQVFTAVQDISEQKKYDFVFDKSSDLTMLFAAQRHDISDLVVRRLTRSAKREQLSNKELKKLEAAEAQEDLEADPDFIDKKKIAEEKKAARQKLIDDRKAAQKAKRDEVLARREQMKLDREAKRNGTKPATAAPANTGTPAGQDDLDADDTPANNANRTATPTSGNVKPPAGEKVQGENSMQAKTTATGTPDDGKQAAIEKQKAAQEQREQKQEERRRIIEERKAKIAADREAAKKARDEKKNKPADKPAEEENKNEN